MTARRQELELAVAGDRCAAWLYPASDADPAPCVVLAHGFGGTREARLWAYAERFQAAGISALVFDYRHFGESTGEPRELLSINRQLEDWRAAIAFARGLAGVDRDRIALWGTSFSGGHVIKLAAEDDRIAAVVSQTPFASGPSTLAAAGLANAVRLTFAGLRDLTRVARRAEPYRLPVVAPPGALGAMTQPDSYRGYMGLFANPDEQFPNQVCARITLTLGAYLPGRSAAALRCPLLVVTVAGDTVTPPPPARGMAERAPRGRLIDYPGDFGHFDIYVGELFERTVVEQTEFLVAALGRAG